MLGHALGTVVDCAAKVLGIDGAQVCAEAKLSLLGQSSLKAALDIDWDDERQQRDALGRLLDEVKRLRAWITAQIPDQLALPPESRSVI